MTQSARKSDVQIRRTRATHSPTRTAANRNSLAHQRITKASGRAIRCSPICRRRQPVLCLDLGHGRNISAVLSGLAEGHRRGCVVDRHYHGGAVAFPVHRPAVRYRLRRTPADPAQGDDHAGFRNSLRIYPGGTASSPARDPDRFRAHGLRVDAAGAADRRLRAERRGALRPQLRADAALGVRCFHCGCDGSGASAVNDRPAIPDLGDRGGGVPERVR